MDLTASFHSLLPAAPPPPKHIETPFFATATTLYTSILTLHRSLLNLRKPYLSLSTSTSAITALDREATTLLQSCTHKLREFAEAENVRRVVEDERRRRDWRGMFKGIDGDKLSAQDKAQREVRDAVLWVLQERLARAGEVVREMREQRMGRNVRRLESGMGAVSKVGGPGGVEVKRWDENLERGNGLEDEEVSGEMMQLLEQENREMVKGFEGMMEGVRNAEKSLLEISELQMQLSANLATQEAHISQLVTDSIDTTENLEKGNQQLKDAAKKASVARSVFWGSVGFSALVVVWDLII